METQKHTSSATFVSIDFETANSDLASICQIGLVRFVDGIEVAAETRLVNPQDDFDPMNIRIHGITASDVADAPTFADLYTWILGWVGNSLVVSHTAFDRTAIQRACDMAGKAGVTWPWLDSARVARRTWSHCADRGFGLKNLAEHLNIQFKHHDAQEDARACGIVLLRAMQDSGLNLSDLEKLLRLKPSQDVSRTGNQDGALFGEVMVFTGALLIPRAEAADMAALAGADVGNGVTKKTTLLVVGAQDLSKLAGHEKSSKHRKAETLIAAGQQIRIISEDEFRALCTTECVATREAA